MRLSISAVVLCLLSGCLDEVHGIREPPPPDPRSVIAFEATVPSPARAVCYAVTTVDATGRTWLAVGDPAARFATLAEAEASGQLCGAEVVAPCGAGLEHEAEAVITGLYTEDGNALPTTDYANPCAASGDCQLTFACNAGVDTRVEFNILLTPDAKQGFFDIAVDAEPREGITELCIALSLESGDGEIVWHRPHLCSSEHGVGASLTIIGTCDAEAPANKVHLWIESITSTDPDAKLVNPCPAEGYDRSKSCVVETTCIQNSDVLVEFEPQLAR